MSEELKVDAIYWQEQRAVYEAKEAAIRRKLQGDLSETYRAHFTEWLAKFPKAYELIDAQIENTRAGLFVDSPLQHFDHPGLRPTGRPLPSKVSELYIDNYDNEIYQKYYGQIETMKMLENKGLLGEEFKDLPERFDQSAGLPLAPRPELEEIQTELYNISQIIFEMSFKYHDLLVESSVQTTTEPATLPTKGRPGRRLGIKPPSTILLPASNHTASPTMLIGKGEWGQGRDNGIISESTRSSAIIVIQSETPDKAEWALNHMNKQSPAVQQAFLGLIALWFNEMPSGTSSDTYYTCRVTDLLRFMGKSQRPGGSYDSEAVLKMGEHIKVIQGLIVHRALKNTYIRAKKGTITEKTETSYIPISIETIETKTETDANGNLVSEPSIEFSFHPSKEIYEAIRGSEKQFISTLPALLKYHPVRQKYHISLGLALLTYQRMNLKNRGNEEISLSALLGLAEIQIPNTSVSRFLGRKKCAETQWESEGILGAIDDLVSDGVVKDVQVVDCTALSARQRLEKITLKTKSKHLKQVS